MMLRFLSPGFKLRPAETPKKIGRPAKKVAEGAIDLSEKKQMRSDKKARTRERDKLKRHLRWMRKKENLRRRMYDMQLQKGKFMPGPCSECDSNKSK